MRKNSADRIIGISAMVISLLTLIMFTYQTKIIHKQSRLSVTPRIGFSSVYSQNDSLVTYSFQIKNKGIGPAIINSAKILWEGKEYDVEMEKFFDDALPDLKNHGSFINFSSVGEGNTLSANETQVIFSYVFKADKIFTIQKYLKVEDEDELPFNLIINYGSIYGESWLIDSNMSSHPKKL